MRESALLVFISLLVCCCCCCFDKSLAGWPESVWQTDVSLAHAVDSVSSCVRPHLCESAASGAASGGYCPIPLFQNFPASSPVACRQTCQVTVPTKSETNQATNRSRLLMGSFRGTDGFYNSEHRSQTWCLVSSESSSLRLSASWVSLRHRLSPALACGVPGQAALPSMALCVLVSGAASGSPEGLRAPPSARPCSRISARPRGLL